MNEPILIQHSVSGANCTIYPYGATITSFETSKKHQVLFVSKLAKRDGSKAIRGGIPLVFPQFGQPNKDMPQHGFLRCNYWTLGKTFDNETEAGCEFTLDLKNVVHARGSSDGLWSLDSSQQSGIDATVTLSVKISAMKLWTILHITNPGKIPFEYQTLFHTYYKVYGSTALQPHCCNVQGLEGYHVYDQITKEHSVQGDEKIMIDREVDRIYTPPSSQGVKDVNVTISTGNDGSKVSMNAFAKMDGKDIPVSCVVWNPFVNKSKAMADFGDEEYNEMICIEPGILSGKDVLKVGQTMEFTQIISVLDQV